MSISNYKTARDKLTFRDDVEEKVDEVEEDDEEADLSDEIK
jgi:hypothetical protein